MSSTTSFSVGLYQKCRLLLFFSSKGLPSVVQECFKTRAWCWVPCEVQRLVRDDLCSLKKVRGSDSGTMALSCTKPKRGDERWLIWRGSFKEELTRPETSTPATSWRSKSICRQSKT